MSYWSKTADEPLSYPDDPFQDECGWTVDLSSCENYCAAPQTDIGAFYDHTIIHIAANEMGDTTCHWLPCKRPMARRELLPIHVRIHVDDRVHRCYYWRRGCYDVFHTEVEKTRHSWECVFGPLKLSARLVKVPLSYPAPPTPPPIAPSLLDFFLEGLVGQLGDA